MQVSLKNLNIINLAVLYSKKKKKGQKFPHLHMQTLMKHLLHVMHGTRDIEVSKTAKVSLLF